MTLDGAVFLRLGAEAIDLRGKGGLFLLRGGELAAQRVTLLARLAELCTKPLQLGVCFAQCVFSTLAGAACLSQFAGQALCRIGPGLDLIAQGIDFRTQRVALGFQRSDALVRLSRGLFDIVDDVFAVKAAENRTLERVAFHRDPTYLGLSIYVIASYHKSGGMTSQK